MKEEATQLQSRFHLNFPIAEILIVSTTHPVYIMHSPDPRQTEPPCTHLHTHIVLVPDKIPPPPIAL